MRTIESLVIVFGLGLASAVASADICKPNECGTNTPYVNGSPFLALNLDGVVNDHGVRFLPRSLDVSGLRGCRHATRLDIVDGEFVGVDDATPPRRVCTGAALVGARFQIAFGDLPMHITIAASDVIPTWDAQRGGAHATRRVRTYRLQPDTRGETSICRYSQPWLDELGNAADGTTALDRAATVEPSPEWLADNTSALLVVGELYDRDANVLAPPASAPALDRWFHVACQGSAVGKMRLLGYDPSTPPPPRLRAAAAQAELQRARDERQATLRMITAKYCGSVSYTNPGTPITWIHVAQAPRPISTSPLESYWEPTGATCLSTPRVSTTNPAGLTCALPVCNNAVVPASTYWITRVPAPAPASNGAPVASTATP